MTPIPPSFAVAWLFFAVIRVVAVAATEAATEAAMAASRAMGEVTTESAEGTVRRQWGGTLRWLVG